MSPTCATFYIFNNLFTFVLSPLTIISHLYCTCITLLALCFVIWYY